MRGVCRVAPGHGKAFGFEQGADRFEGWFGGNARGSPSRIFGGFDSCDKRSGIDFVLFSGISSHTLEKSRKSERALERLDFGDRDSELGADEVRDDRVAFPARSALAHADSLTGIGFALHAFPGSRQRRSRP